MKKTMKDNIPDNLKLAHVRCDSMIEDIKNGIYSSADKEVNKEIEDVLEDLKAIREALKPVDLAYILIGEERSDTINLAYEALDICKERLEATKEN